MRTIPNVELIYNRRHTATTTNIGNVNAQLSKLRDAIFSCQLQHLSLHGCGKWAIGIGEKNQVYAEAYTQLCRLGW